MEGVYLNMQTTSLLGQDKRDCCGCCACEAVCPANAIEMQRDNEGFFYPQINENKCIGCKKCERVCAFKKKKAEDRTSTIKKQYAIKFLRDEIRIKSQAGGSFAALAIALLEGDEKAVIYGATYYEVYRVKHIKIDNKKDISLLQGSKYIQSDMIGIYNEIANDLRNNRTVMFAGTPCQNHAVKIFLKTINVNTEQLYLMDFVCKGVASPRVWESYIKSVEKHFRADVETVVFRNKRYGWKGHYETLKIKDMKRLVIGRKWTNCFCKSLFLRESCYACRYTSQNRESDITVSMFSNVDRKIPEFDDGKGVSGMMINSLKGAQWFERIKDEMEVMPVTMDDLMQKQLQHPIDIPQERGNFWNDFEKEDTWDVLSKYDKKIILIKNLIKNIIQRKLKWV